MPTIRILAVRAALLPLTLAAGQWYLLQQGVEGGLAEFLAFVFPPQTSIVHAGSVAVRGPSPGHPADLDGDGAVGILDFLELLESWGVCA